MTREGVAFSIQNSAELTLGIVGLLSNSSHLEEVSHRAGEYVSSRTGATGIIMQEFNKLMASGGINQN